MGRISLSSLRKKVKRIEEQNEKFDKIKKLKERAEEERRILNSKLKRLRMAKTPLGKFRKRISKIAERSRPLARRIKLALDEASRNV